MRTNIISNDDISWNTLRSKFKNSYTMSWQTWLCCKKNCLDINGQLIIQQLIMEYINFPLQQVNIQWTLALELIMQSLTILMKGASYWLLSKVPSLTLLGRCKEPVPQWGPVWACLSTRPTKCVAETDSSAWRAYGPKAVFALLCFWVRIII